MSEPWEPPLLPEAASRPRDQTIARLGAGGMAEVFLIRRTGPGGFEKFLALKRIRAGLDAETFAPMLLDEARLVAALQHPNIVQVHDAGSDDDGLWFLMEYVHGRSLGSLLGRAVDRGVQVPVECAAYIIACVGRALHYAHHAESATTGRLGVIHRDVSPGNILIGYDGVVKLADFGIARANQRQSQTQDGTFKGKYGYAAPEQCRGESLDGGSDLFSLGIVMHELLTSRHLFSTDAPLATVEAVLHAPIPRLSELRDDVPPQLDDLVSRMLARDRAARIGSGAAIANELDAIAHDKQLPATRERMAELMTQLFTSTEMRLQVPAAPAEGMHTPLRTPLAGGTPARATGQHGVRTSSQHSSQASAQHSSQASAQASSQHPAQASARAASQPGYASSHHSAETASLYPGGPGTPSTGSGRRLAHSSQPGRGAGARGSEVSRLHEAGSLSPELSITTGTGQRISGGLPSQEVPSLRPRASAAQRLAAAAIVGALSAVGVTMLLGRSNDADDANDARPPAPATSPATTTGAGAAGDGAAAATPPTDRERIAVPEAVPDEADGSAAGARTVRPAVRTDDNGRILPAPIKRPATKAGAKPAHSRPAANPKKKSNDESLLERNW